MIALTLASIACCAQAQTGMPSFEVASVRPSKSAVGPDYNNQITITRAGYDGRNVTLKRLIAEAWNVQINQVLGPGWIGQNEYNVEARFGEGADKEHVASMLKSLLADRFKLRERTETREMRAYDLTVAKDGAKVHPVAPGEAVKAGPGFHFQGDMNRFADLLAVQFSIQAPVDPSVPSTAGGPPIVVLNKTGLEGNFDFTVDIHPEMGTDSFTAWKRALEEQLGMKIESQKGAVPVVVVDEALKIPTAN